MKLFVFDIYIQYIFILYFLDKYIFERETIKILIKPVTSYCLFLSDWRVAFFAGGDFLGGIIIHSSFGKLPLFWC